MTHLCNEDVGLEVVALSNCINDFDCGSTSAPDAVRRQLFLPHVGPWSVIVVLPIDHESRLVGRKSSHDVAPTFVVVHTNSNGNELARGVRFEAKHARRAASTHSEGQNTISVGPSATVGKVPVGFLDEGEQPASGATLKDAKLNSV